MRRVVLVAIGGRCYAVPFGEGAVEGTGRFKAAFVENLGNTALGGAQKRAGIVQTQRVDIGAETGLEAARERVGQVGFADAQSPGKLRQGERFGEVQRKILQNPVRA